MVRDNALYQKLYGKYKDILDAVQKKNQEKQRQYAQKDSIPLISLLCVMVDRGTKVRVVIFHPDSVQEKFGGPFGWLESWGIVRYWSPWNSDRDKCIDLQLAMWGGPGFEGSEMGGHHQKSAVVATDNGLVGFCGGIDIAESRWTLSSHLASDQKLDSPNPKDYILGEYNGKEYMSMPGSLKKLFNLGQARGIPLWHDVHTKVVGPAAYDLAQNFADRYLKADTKLRIKAANKMWAASDYKKTSEYKKYPETDALILDRGFESKADVRKEIGNYKNQSNVSTTLLSSNESYSQGAVFAQILRTYDPYKDYSIWDVYKNLLSMAEKSIYIESQYAFEDTDMSGSDVNSALMNNIVNNKQLKVIIVAPVMPDNYDDKIRANLKKLMEASQKDIWKSNVACYSLQSMLGARRLPIYVHAKLAVVDDTWAIVGSANLDSMGVSHYGYLIKGSSEIAILVNGKDQALALRRKLVQEHLGSMSPSNPDNFDEVFDAFKKAANANGAPNETKQLSADVHVVWHRAYW